MEPRMRMAKGGFMLVTVLIITAVGLLFGAGALLLFRYQCQMRIDRQHEMEKVYAVRSALNYTRTNTGEIPENGIPFKYYAGSERNLGLFVKPVDPIFAVMGKNVASSPPFIYDAQSVVMYWKHFAFTNSMQRGTCGTCDYEFGSKRAAEFLSPTNDIAISSRLVDGESKYGPEFNLTTTNNVKWWLNVAMCGTGGWLENDYGRRYCFWPQDYVKGASTMDVMRLCIIRNVTNALKAVGCTRGWPLSKAGEKALVFEIRPYVNGNNADMMFFEYEQLIDDGDPQKKLLLTLPNCPSLSHMGFQIAGDIVSLFYINTKAAAGDNLAARGYTFSDGVAQLTAQTYKYFSDEVSIGNITYGGIYTNMTDGKVHAPELRAVFEVEAFSDERIKNSKKDFMTDFKVTPAYQYDVFLEYPVGWTNLATVAQKIGTYHRTGRNYSILTYDTHGTDHKGFRQDEKEWAAKRGGGN